MATNTRTQDVCSVLDMGWTRILPAFEQRTKLVVQNQSEENNLVLCFVERGDSPPDNETTSGLIVYPRGTYVDDAANTDQVYGRAASGTVSVWAMEEGA